MSDQLKSKKIHCLQNTRGLNIDNKCQTDSIRFNLHDFKNGLRISSTTFNFVNREKMVIRILNTYYFGNVKIVAIWRNSLQLLDVSTEFGKMKMNPKIVSIWLYVDDIIINGISEYSIPVSIIDKLIIDINTLIGNQSVIIDNINIDQFEMLRLAKIYPRPDLIFEKLLIYTDTRKIASNELIQFRRDMPDNIEMIVTIEQINESKLIII